jgi:hypothetical protein
MKSIPLSKLQKIYSADLLVEVTDKDSAISDLKSKTSCCWGAGRILEGGWVTLAKPSPRRKGEKATQFVCKLPLVNDFLKSVEESNLCQEELDRTA